MEGNEQIGLEPFLGLFCQMENGWICGWLLFVVFFLERGRVSFYTSLASDAWTDNYFFIE